MRVFEVMVCWGIPLEKTSLNTDKNNEGHQPKESNNVVWQLTMPMGGYPQKPAGTCKCQGYGTGIRAGTDVPGRMWLCTRNLQVSHG